MFGPRLEIQAKTKDNRALTMRAIESEDLEVLPTKLDLVVTRFLSTDTKRDLAELVTNREKSREYDYWKHGRDRVIWGIFAAQNNEPARLVGYTGFRGYIFSNQPSDWYAAESYSVLFTPDAMGKGIATATHPYRNAFAFAMGVSCLRSSVILGNERSAHAMTSASYAFFGIDHPDKDFHKRYEFRHYHPNAGSYAETNASVVAAELEVASLDIAAVEDSKQYVAGLLRAMPTVVETAELWMDEQGPRLEYLPRAIPPQA